MILCNYNYNVDFDPCIPNPCLNGGICLPAIETGQFSCECRKDCYGPNCESCNAGIFNILIYKGAISM